MKKKSLSKSAVQEAQVDSTHEEILRIIGNARCKYNTCVMARNRHGMGEYGRLARMLVGVSDQRLSAYLDAIDEVRATHLNCARCSLKFLAFCRHYCAERLPERLNAYVTEYDRYNWRGVDRDFMAEVAQAIRKNAKDPPQFPTQIRRFLGDKVPGLEEKSTGDERLFA